MKWLKRSFIILLSILLAFFLIIGGYYILQRYVAHIEESFRPDYEKVDLTENTDYETVFLQTGLGRTAVQRLKAENRFDEILEAQNFFFENQRVECREFLGWFTLQDKIEGKGYKFYDLQAGDILVTLSTHSFGWRHGHAAIVLNEAETIESFSLGTVSAVKSLNNWHNYSNFAVLRVKDKTEIERKAVSDFATEKLNNIPYSIFSGFRSSKAPNIDSEDFTLHCSYLAWYAWNSFGVDLDFDGGRLVTVYDILHSDKVEIVQLYGFNPKDFL